MTFHTGSIEVSVGGTINHIILVLNSEGDVSRGDRLRYHLCT